MNPSRFPQVQSYGQVRAQLAKTIDLYIADLRSMLQLPLRIIRKRDTEPDLLLVELEGGCNFASGTLILDIVAGLSVCFYFRQKGIGLETERDRADRFKEFLKKYYPWQYESLGKDRVSDILWKFLRNPLVHSLGVLPLNGKCADITRVQVNKSDLTSVQIQELEDASRPAWLPSAFELRNSTFHVNIPSLYWGLHELLRTLFSDDDEMSRVENWYAKMRPEKSRLEALYGSVKPRRKPEDFKRLRRQATAEAAKRALEE